MRHRVKHPVRGVQRCYCNQRMQPRLCQPTDVFLMFAQASFFYWAAISDQFWLFSFAHMCCDINHSFHFIGSVCWLAVVCRSWVGVQQLGYCTNTQNTKTAGRKAGQPCMGFSFIIKNMILISAGLLSVWFILWIKALCISHLLSSSTATFDLLMYNW